ncbi:hypothetical protein [Sphingomonas sp. CARO-RG-8B-R24-01]|uniref:hypothetical protein n=1 Tax=Sphingomonas sp. CARO-RG-8B-R24-01 TaxID=2914831 RepID=UPI001F58C6B4|nr:hypothetical protein [Sphingomonas sp. CARO-RG-8B-R24-01]
MTAPPEFGAAIEVGGVRWGDEIALTDGKPRWLSEGVMVWPCSGDDLDGHSRMWSAPYAAQDIKVWDVLEAIRLEVPRYDFVYLALERGMVPWFGGDEAPGDLADDAAIVFRDGGLGTVMGVYRWDHTGSGGDIIGYTRKASSTALPLAHPAAEEPRQIYVWWADNGNIRKWSHEPFAEGELTLAHPAAPQGEDSAESARIVRWIDQAIERAKRHGNTEGIWLFASQWQVVRAALAPAAIASGREGAA